MSDTTTTAVAGKAQPKAVPAGELTELARLEIRTGKILEVRKRKPVPACLQVDRSGCGFYLGAIVVLSAAAKHERWLS